MRQKIRTYPAKLACTASGMPFEEWRNRPAYRVHCKTASIAYALLSRRDLSLQKNEEVFAFEFGAFRCLRPYRNAAADRLRAAVAKALKAERSNRTIGA